jgi:hypothetical protein
LTVKVWELGWLARAGLVPLILLQLVWGGDAMLFYGEERLKAAIALIEAGYDGKSDESRFNDKGPARQVTAATPEDAVILARNYKGLLGVDRTVLSDIRAAQDYISYSHLRDARELYELLRARGVTHLLYPEGKRQPARWNNTVLFAELFHRHARNERRLSGGLRLAEMPASAPEPAAPFLVLVDGISGYRDGVYKVEQLDIDEKRSRYFKPSPKPIEALKSDNAAELLETAQAVVLKAPNLSEEARQVLSSEFELVERFKDSELHLRREPSRR